MSQTPLPAAANEDITLVHDDLRLVVSPYGASIRGLSRGDKAIITHYSGAENKVGGQGDVLIPFPGRINHGAYTLDGRSYQMEINDKEGPNAIHGFLRTVVWDIARQSADTITFQTSIAPDDYEGYPFALKVQVRYGIGPDGFSSYFSIENTGATAAPVAAGFHPYFTVSDGTIDGDILQVPFKSRLEFNDELIPTGKVLPVAGTDFDFVAPRPIGGVAINTCYLDPIRDADGQLRVSLQSADGAKSVTVWMDEHIDYVVLYSGDVLSEDHRRRSLAIEPMTCGSDAFNHPEWGLVVLQPGQEYHGSWGVTDRISPLS
jgi:aldose 1-epimerase